MDLDDVLDDDRYENFNDKKIFDCDTYTKDKHSLLKKNEGVFLESNSLNGLSSPLSSEESTRISLQSIREKRAGLNRHRQSILDRVPDRETYSSFKLNYVEYKDLAYLSAATGDEFALLRGKNEDILYHGTPRNCHIEKSETLMELLNSHKVRLEIHSHPDYGKIVASDDDRRFIASFGQKSSKIISSYTGKIAEFSSNLFEDIY